MPRFTLKLSQPGLSAYESGRVNQFPGWPRKRGPHSTSVSFDAICAACGTPTTVPFEPRQGREVYCRECFQNLRQDDR